MSKKLKQNRGTFRFPFDIDRRIFLLLALFFLIFSIKPINRLFFPRFNASSLKTLIQKSYKSQQQEFEIILSDKKQLKDFANNKLSTNQIEDLNKQNWGLSIYKNDSIQAWSNERIINNIIPAQTNIPTAYNIDGNIGISITKKIKIHGQAFLVKGDFPLYIKYKNENEYLTSRFNIGTANNHKSDDYGHYLKVYDELVDKNLNSQISFGKQAQFILKEKSNVLDIYDKNPWHFFFAALPFIFFGISIHTFLKVSVRRNPLLYFSLVIITAIGIRTLTYLFGFPDNYSEFQLFNPELYASSITRSSLGDLFINRCLIFWVFLFFIINVQFKVYNPKKKVAKILYAIIALLFLYWIGSQSLQIGKSLILDSILNYDTTNYKNVTFEKFIGFATFLILFTNYVIAIIITHRYIKRITPIRGLRYLSIFIFPIMYFFIGDADTFNETILLTAWTCLFFFFLDSKFLETKFDFNSYKLLYWIIILTTSCSLMFNYIVNQKEKTTRINLAEKLMNFDNQHGIDRIIKLKQKLKDEKLVDQIFSAKSIFEVEKLSKSISISNYDEKYFITTSAITAVNHLTKATITNPNFLNQKFKTADATHKVYLDTTFGKEKYYTFLKNPLNNKKCKGFIITGERLLNIEHLSPLNPAHKTPYRSTLEYDYEIAFYENGVRKNQIGNTDFPYRLGISQRKMVNNHYFTNNNFSTNTLTLFENAGQNNKVILIRKKGNTFFQFSTTYAYIFSVIFLIISLYILGNIIARSNFRYARFVNLIGLTLRMRIHLAILSVELIAFIFIGFISIYFYSMRSEKIVVQDTIQSSIKTEKNLTSETIHALIRNKSNKDSSLKQQFVGTNNSTETYNIYSLKGILLYSKNNQKVNGKIFTDYINPIAKHELEINASQNSMLKETIGSYEYFSVYNYLRDETGKPLAILQSPNLISQNRTKKEIASLIISLINIYTIIFLLSSIIAFFITKRLTRSFTTIVNQFSKINLTKTNTPLNWPYSDEIGLLVKEYNRTLLKLENNTMLLAKSERETAWREISKQIAHEIKNPLTPISLSLQTLQNAIKKDDPNLKEKTVRMTKTVLEQIKVLTRIAGNFSEFAKMSDIDAKEESLRSIIKASTGIYTDNEEAEFLFILPDEEIKVLVDRVKLIRVLTNILQNALQSVPEGTVAYITLTVSKHKTNLIRVSISDNGSGIPNELVDKIFEPKFTTKSSGSGLGLAMCKDIMSKSGGDISFETKSNKGTVFHIDIPVYQEEEEDLMQDDEDF